MRRRYASASQRPVRLLPRWKETEMSEEQARAFRIMAVGYAVLRGLSEEVGPRAVRAMASGVLTEGDLARALGRAAIAAVDDEGEVERNG